MIKQNKKVIAKARPDKLAFTLVELIVVITIIAILGTIAFISLQGYSKTARDSRRISDVNNIKTSLELFSLNTGKYPIADNAENVTYSGATVILWKQGTIGNVVTTNLSKNLNKKPTDPLYETEYIYSTLENGSKYEVLNIFEGDLASNNLLLDNTYAASNTVKIVGTYNGIYIKTGNYIIPSPSIITSEILPLDFNATTIKSQVIDGGTNIPNIGTSNVTVSTGGLTFNAFEVYNGVLDKNSSTGAFLLAYNAIANTYSGSSIANNGEIKTLLSQTDDDDKINFTKTIVLNTASSVSSTPNITYSCTGTVPPSNVIKTNDTDLTADTTWQTLDGLAKCYYQCSPGYTGTNCEIEPILDWTLVDTNCDIVNIHIPTGCTEGDAGCQIWAGCNSTLGTGIEYSNETNCYNYDEDGNGANDNLGLAGACGEGHLGDSNDNAKAYFESIAGEGGTNGNGDSEVDNIWGKLYVWSEVSKIDNTGPCRNGYKLPSDNDWEILETTLNGGINCRNLTDGRLCDGLGWSGHTSKNNTNNIIQALKLPLAGYRDTDGVTFFNRGYNMNLWSSTTNGSDAYNRNFIRNNSTVYRINFDQAYGFSVRCIKD